MGSGKRQDAQLTTPMLKAFGRRVDWLLVGLSGLVYATKGAFEEHALIVCPDMFPDGVLFPRPDYVDWIGMSMILAWTLSAELFRLHEKRPRLCWRVRFLFVGIAAFYTLSIVWWGLWGA